MTELEYKTLQSRLSRLVYPERMKLIRIYGKRKDGYELAILAAKSMLEDFYIHNRSDKKENNDNG